MIACMGSYDSEESTHQHITRFVGTVLRYRRTYVAARTQRMCQVSCRVIKSIKYYTDLPLTIAPYRPRIFSPTTCSQPRPWSRRVAPSCLFLQRIRTSGTTTAAATRCLSSAAPGHRCTTTPTLITTDDIL